MCITNIKRSSSCNSAGTLIITKYSTRFIYAALYSYATSKCARNTNRYIMHSKTNGSLYGYMNRSLCTQALKHLVVLTACLWLVLLVLLSVIVSMDGNIESAAAKSVSLCSPANGLSIMFQIDVEMYSRTKTAHQLYFNPWNRLSRSLPLSFSQCTWIRVDYTAYTRTHTYTQTTADINTHKLSLLVHSAICVSGRVCVCVCVATSHVQVGLMIRSDSHRACVVFLFRWSMRRLFTATVAVDVAPYKLHAARVLYYCRHRRCNHIRFDCFQRYILCVQYRADSFLLPLLPSQRYTLTDLLLSLSLFHTGSLPFAFVSNALRALGMYIICMERTREVNGRTREHFISQLKKLMTMQTTTTTMANALECGTYSTLRSIGAPK